MMMPCDDASTRGSTVRRIEVFEAGGPRGKWPPETKARIIAESYAGAGTVCDVARRHGLAPTQLFTWRRDAKLPRAARSAPMFAPVVVDPPALPFVAHELNRSRSRPGARARAASSWRSTAW